MSSISLMSALPLASSRSHFIGALLISNDGILCCWFVGGFRGGVVTGVVVGRGGCFP